MQAELANLRKELHQIPELSGQETNTAARIAEELKNCNPDHFLQHLGGNGVAALFQAKNGKPKKTILFRAELDAIPVTEKTALEYQSKNKGVMHGCGHDGHMAILIGLARLLEKERPDNVDVWLLFQPAEETGEGAAALLDDPEFQKLDIDQGFALHNLPGFPENSILIKEGPFACASTGFEIDLKGTFSHAAYPGQGLNPVKELTALLMEIEEAMQPFSEADSSHKFVITFVKMGERAFGVSPGEASLGVTIRAASDKALDEGVEIIEKTVSRSAKRFEGEVSWSLREPFAATVNNADGVHAVEKAAEKSGFRVTYLDEPFAWSEDFGEFRRRFPVTLFGLGAGEEGPHLHSEKYDFNDALLPAGIEIFRKVVDYYSEG